MAHFSLSVDKSGWQLGGRETSQQVLFLGVPRGVGIKKKTHKSTESCMLLGMEGHLAEVTWPVNSRCAQRFISAALRLFLRDSYREQRVGLGAQHSPRPGRAPLMNIFGSCTRLWMKKTLVYGITTFNNHCSQGPLPQPLPQKNCRIRRRNS